MSGTWYQSSYRRNLVDMHIEAWDESFLSEFDPHIYFDCLKRARIQSPMIYTHSHVGYCNWPTATGETHPAFLREDKIKTLIGLCRADGMDVVAYYSLIYNNRVYEQHPDWRMRDINGAGSRDHKEDNGFGMMFGQGRYGLLCPNNGAYRAFLRAQLAELCGHYDFQGIFLDMTFWPMVCYCDSCRARFRAETGAELPELIDWDNEDWLRFQAKREEWMGEFAAFCTSEIKSLRPGLTVEHQFSTATHPWVYGARREIGNASDYVGGDLYGGLEQQSFICKLYYGLTRHQPFEYMTSRCDPGLNDHTTTKPFSRLMQHACLTYAHHGAFLAIDAIDPRGTLNGQFYDTLGHVFCETMAYEPFLTGSMRADAAVYFSLGSKMELRAKERRPAIHDRPQEYSHLTCSVGAGQALRRAHIPYAVITGPDGLAACRVVVLSDAARLEADEIERLAAYVQGGGALYISGITAPELADRLLGLRVLGQTEETVTYIRPTDTGQPYFAGAYTARYPMTVFGTQTLAAYDGQAEVLAKLTLPYTRPADMTTFASIHSNPPGVDTEYPSLLLAQYGRGRVLWSSAPFESSEQPTHKRVFADLIGLLAGGEPMIKTDAPAYIEFTVFQDDRTGRTLLHCVNINEDAVPSPSFTVAVRRDGQAVNSVRALPDMTEIPFAAEGDTIVFTLDGGGIFRMVAID